MKNTITPMGFFSRFFGAFLQFFKYLGDGDYAARCKLVGEGQLFSTEVEPTVVYEEVDIIREIEVPSPVLASVNSDGAMQLLQLFQQEARLIDFLQEPIDSYTDEEVGAASRQIHLGCSKTLKQFFEITTISHVPEGESLTIDSGYNPKEYKLEGRVEGQGPFRGTLIHAGWKVSSARLPQVTNTESLSILAPAEVEV
ncbi:DUF2760 domain-containing protein [Marinomonas sp. 15G1-11]|uniref:DUF2760 domain-containing protein n=1 Tax=Marinomonas phaeophyticola TaxID=3004091 RepID=A0ABT4JQD9_9GAMM|nr:DUF2760 domain-containing protein [Marinomonas sp. 15G1-11]MCZ2720371.1 DUF2760 domain-containing protein [Marinomonas sp. 15G1-11]